MMSERGILETRAGACGSAKPGTILLEEIKLPVAVALWV